MKLPENLSESRFLNFLNIAEYLFLPHELYIEVKDGPQCNKKHLSYPYVGLYIFDGNASSKCEETFN